MKFVGWELYNMKFVCYIAGAISKDMRWFIVAALFAIAHELWGWQDSCEVKEQTGSCIYIL